jgi:N6-adenosine-specific RNA methylase IME4
MPEFHELANVFPILPDNEIERLAADIEANGQRHAITLYQGKILDGRNRYKACELIGVEPRYTEYTGDDPIAYIISENIARRHLDESQRAACAAILANIVNGGDRKSNQFANLQTEKVTQPEAAILLNVSPRLVASAVKIKNERPDLFTSVQSGDMTINYAEREIKESKREQRRDDNRSKVNIAKPLSEVGAKFSTIAIDPPWDWGDEGDQDQLGRARPTYSTMTIDQLFNLPVDTLSDIDCHLYLWITNRSLPKGFALLEKWGFRYITCITWVKPSFGMGNYFRGQTEHILFGVKGSQMLKRKDAPTVFCAPRGPNGHSSKPIEFYDFVESCSPGPYLELFARSGRKDWTSWGGEL